MKLYRFKYPFSVVSATNEAEATDRFNERVQNEEIDPPFFQCIIDHADFVKIFRLARMLNEIDQFDFKNIEAIVAAYVKSLGYELTEQELWDGFLVWAERFSDADDEDIENWIN